MPVEKKRNGVCEIFFLCMCTVECVVKLFSDLCSCWMKIGFVQDNSNTHGNLFFVPLFLTSPNKN